MLLTALDTERPISGQRYLSAPTSIRKAGSAYSARLHPGIRAAWAIISRRRGLTHPGEVGSWARGP
jgi:hypothetical protein